MRAGTGRGGRSEGRAAGARRAGGLNRTGGTCCQPLAGPSGARRRWASFWLRPTVGGHSPVTAVGRRGGGTDGQGAASSRHVGVVAGRRREVGAREVSGRPVPSPPGAPSPRGRRAALLARGAEPCPRSAGPSPGRDVSLGRGLSRSPLRQRRRPPSARLGCQAAGVRGERGTGRDGRLGPV